MNMQRALAAAICGAPIIAPAGVSRAQTETDSANAVRHGKAEASLAKAAQNPVANTVSRPLNPRRAGANEVRFSVAALWPTAAAEAKKKKKATQVAAKKKNEKPER
jgi:hypothetical protein